MRALSQFGKHALQGCFMRGAFMWRLPRGVGCALTFDDGPHEVYTPQILELLARHQVKASFFVVGKSAARAPDLVCRIVAEGHRIASHTYSHRELPTLGRDELQQELQGCRQLIKELTGVDTMLVRPPRGRMDLTSLIRLKQWGYRLIHWSKTYSDYLQDGSDSLLERIRAAGLDSGDIALFHDTNPYTVDALSEMLPQWQAAGRTFVALP